jgi:mono/diheme cytochrome c family protein
MIRRVVGWTALALMPLVLATLAVAAVLFARQGGFEPYRVPRGGTREIAGDAATVARGAYLVKIGDCAACHTTRGGVPFAGGRAFPTGTGTLYSSNITPDKIHGIGDWSADEFTHAMRHGVSRRGPLYPVFPYRQFARLTDADIDAIHAYLRTLAPSATDPPPNRLEFPANSRNALIAWRMFYDRPAEAPRDDAGDRGRYLVDGLGHCVLCHSARGPRYSLPEDGYLAGGRIPVSGWYAPPLGDRSLARFSEDELASYLRSGASPHGDAYGPMAEVVYASLAALTDDDAHAMARYLKQVPEHARARRDDGESPPRIASSDGADVYQHACADCHGDNGEGKTPRYPPLKDAVSVRATDPVNAVRMVLYGAMPPTTPGNPRPYTMPPFVQTLSSADIAAVVNYIRRDNASAARLKPDEVQSMQGVVLD